MTFWDNVEVLRKEQNTSYRWLAHKMGVSETTVSSMRKSGTEPRASEAVKIADALGTTVEFLVHDFSNESHKSLDERNDNYFFKYKNLKSELTKILESF